MKKMIVVILFLASTASFAQNRPSNEKLMTDQKGFLTCTGGGSSAPLFTRDCAKLNLSRISSPGSIKYEGTCLDSNETTFYVACDSFTLEYGQIVTNKPKDLTLGE
jgi:hypothetical protein